MRGTDRWGALRTAISQGDRFLLTSHVFPEGDAIGSEIALALHLRSLGKQVVIVNDDPALDRYEFLTRLFPVMSWSEFQGQAFYGWTQVAICLDASSWDYLGAVGRWIRMIRPRVISIDHHRRTEPFGDVDVILEDASSTGEVLYRYFRAVGARVTPEMAEALYASILFDTWGFRLPNTKNETLGLAAELLRYGVDHRAMCRNLFETDTLSKIDLLRLALGTVRSESDGRLVWLAIPEDLFLATGTHFTDSDGILDQLLGLRQVEICAMFRQQGQRGVKATFRSKGSHDVGRLATELGGGGRSTASGALLPLAISEAIACVLPRLQAMLPPSAIAVDLDAPAFQEESGEPFPARVRPAEDPAVELDASALGASIVDSGR